MIVLWAYCIIMIIVCEAPVIVYRYMVLYKLFIVIIINIIIIIKKLLLLVVAEILLLLYQID